MFGSIVGSPVGNEFAAFIDTLCLLGSKFLGRVGLLVVASGSEAVGCSEKINGILEINQLYVSFAWSFLLLSS